MKFKFTVVTLLVLGLVFGLASIASARTTTIALKAQNEVVYTVDDTDDEIINNIPMLIFNVSADTSIVVTAMTVTHASNATNPSYAAKVWKDTNKNGVIDKGDTALLAAPVTLANGAATTLLTFAAGQAIGAGAANSLDFIITLNKLAAAEPTDAAVELTLDDANALTITAGPLPTVVDVIAHTATSTLVAETATNVPSLAVADVEGVVTGSDAAVLVALATVPNKKQDVKVAAFKLTATTGSHSVHTLNIADSGTASDLTGVQLFIDTNANGTVDTGEPEIEISTPTALGVKTLTQPVFIAAGASKTFIVIVDFTGTGLNASAHTVTMTAATSLFDHTSGDVVTTDVASGTQTLAAITMTAATKDYANFPYKAARPNGYLDAVKITFNMAVDDATVKKADFSVYCGAIGISADDSLFVGTDFNGTYQGDVVNNNVVNITFTEMQGIDAPLGRTGDTGVDVAYSAATKILSIDGNYALPTQTVIAADGAAPAPLSIKTINAAVPTKGKLDRIDIQFSEQLAAITPATVVAAMTAAGDTVYVAALAVGDAAWGSGLNTVLQLTLTDNKSDTGAKPAVTFAGGGSLKDGATTPNNVLAWVGLTDIPTFDTAVPVILSTTTKDNNNNSKLDALAIKFSEPVKLAAGMTQANLTDDVTGFMFENGFETVYSFADSGHTGIGTNTITMVVNESEGEDTGVKPAVSYTGDPLIDFAVAMNAVDDVAMLTMTDGISAKLLSASTVDGGVTFDNWPTPVTTSRNGKIDAYKLVFSEQMTGIDSLYNAFKIGGVPVAKDSTKIVGDTVYLKIKEGSTDTGTLAQVTYDTTGIGKERYVKDLGGGTLKPIAADTIVETDAVAPYFSATTKDIGAGKKLSSTSPVANNGRIDAIMLSFSEAIDTTGARGNGTVGSGLWGGLGVSLGSSYVVADTLMTFGTDLKSMTIPVIEIGTGNDTATVPTVTFTATGISKVKDAKGNIMETLTKTPSDGVAPIIVDGSRTIDNNKDGFIDGVILTFSESVQVKDAADTTSVRANVVIAASSKNKVDLTNAKIHTNATSWDSPTAANEIKLVGTSTATSGKWDTNVKPDVAIKASSGIRDLAKNNARAYTAAEVKTGSVVTTPDDSVHTVDGAGPVLIQVSGQLNSKDITLRFSEPVTMPTTSDIVYMSASGLNAINAFALAGSDTSTYVAKVDSTLTMARLTVDSLRVVDANTIDDTANGTPAANYASADTIAIYDAVLPTLVKAETMDVDDNGRIDNIKLTFSENLDESNIAGVPTSYYTLYFGYTAGIDTLWTVEGYKVLGINLTNTAAKADSATRYLRASRVIKTTDPAIQNVGDVIDDNIIYLSVLSTTEMETYQGDTGAKPKLSMKGGAKPTGAGVSDFTPNYVASISNVTVSDAVPPEIMAADMPSRTVLQLFMSEPFKTPLTAFNLNFLWLVGTEKTAWEGQSVNFTQDPTNLSMYNVQVLSPGVPYDSPATIAFKLGATLKDANSVTVVLAVGDTISVTPPTAVGVDVAAVPAEFGLSKNFPNPFNPTTTINYDIADDGGLVSLVIYNMTGQKVRTLVSEVKAPGYYTVTWDGMDESGASVSSGIYLYKLVCGSFSQIEKMTMVK